MFKIRVNLLTQMTLLIIFVVFISTLLVSILFSTLLEDIVENHMGKQAMTVAKLADSKSDDFSSRDLTMNSPQR